MADKRYYWLKLKENFFDDDTISWLEEQQNGKEYVLFYLKLCLKSLKSNGYLIREVGHMLIPYDEKKLAEITKTDFDTVVIAMGLLKNLGLVEIKDSGEIYMAQLQSMVGSETSAAERMRKIRSKTIEQNEERNNVTQKCNNVTKECNNVTQEYRDRDREKSLEQDINTTTINCGCKPKNPKKPSKLTFGEYGHIKLTKDEHDRLIEEFGEATIQRYIKSMDEWLELNGKKPYKNFNLALRKWMSKDNIQPKGGTNGTSSVWTEGVI